MADAFVAWGAVPSPGRTAPRDAFFATDISIPMAGFGGDCRWVLFVGEGSVRGGARSSTPISVARRVHRSRENSHRGHRDRREEPYAAHALRALCITRSQQLVFLTRNSSRRDAEDAEIKTYDSIPLRVLRASAAKVFGCGRRPRRVIRG